MRRITQVAHKEYYAIFEFVTKIGSNGPVLTPSSFPQHSKNISIPS